MKIRLLSIFISIFTALFAVSAPTAVHAELVCGKVRGKLRPQLVIKRTSGDSCPRKSKLIVDTTTLTGAQGPQGATGPTGATGATGATGMAGADGDSSVLCFARINASADTVTTFGGSTTTNVTTAEGGNSARNIVTCTGSYPGISGVSDLTVIATEVSTGIVDPIAFVTGGSSASSSSIAVEIQTDSGNVDFNVLVLGTTS